MTAHSKTTIKAGGRTYPCYETMGAMLRYEREAGKPVGEAMTSADMLLFLHCLALSACAAEGVEPPSRDLQEFADGLLPADFVAWSQEWMGPAPQDAGAEKKS